MNERTNYNISMQWNAAQQRKQRTITTQNNMNKFQKQYPEQQKTGTKGCMLFDPIYMKFQNWRNYGDRKRVSACPEAEVKEGFSAKGCKGTLAVMEIVLATFLDSINLML